jgi:hypothetical protein
VRALGWTVVDEPVTGRRPRRVVPRVVPLLLAVGFALVALCTPARAAVETRAVTTLAAGPGSTPNAPTLPVEQRFYAPGPWEVTSVRGIGCCDSGGSKFDAWYPTDLGRDGTRHPVITFGDGWLSTPDRYDYFLRHLASWGFVVVATESTDTGSGRQILDAAHWMLRQDESASPFHDRLDTGAVGAVGHSEGASGVLNAMVNSGGLISTTITIELPPRVYCTTTPANCADTRKLTGGGIFLVNGSVDALISPSYLPVPTALLGPQSNSAYQSAAPGSVSTVWATLNGADHSDVQGQPSCAGAHGSCTNGVYGYLGYPTAWLMARLRRDDEARSAFVDQTGELFRETTNWSNQHSNIRAGDD